MFTQDAMSRWMFSLIGVFAVSLLAGCAGRPSLFPNSDKDLRKTSVAFAADAAKRNTLEELYSRVTEQARNQYTLAYSPQGNDKGKDYHSVEVRVKRSGLNIITREGYYSTLIAQ